MMSYLLIGAVIWFLIWAFGSYFGSSSSVSPVNQKLDKKSKQPVTSLPEPKPSTLLSRLSDASEKMHAKSVAYLDDTTFDLSYCGWFPKFKILVDSRLKSAKFRIEQQEKFEKDPKLRAIYEQVAGPTLTLEQLLDGQEVPDDVPIDHNQLLYENLPPPPQTDDLDIGPRQMAIYQHRLHEHNEYIRIIRNELLEKPNLCKLFLF